MAETFTPELTFGRFTSGVATELTTGLLRRTIFIDYSGSLPLTPKYTAVVARPTPSGTVHTVNTSTGAAAIAALYATLSPGDCLEFDDGIYLQPDCFPSGWNRPGVIVRAKNRGAYDADPMGGGNGPHHARFQRKAIFEYDSRLGGTTSTVSAANVTIHDFEHRLTSGLWPADNALWTSVCPAGGVTTYWGFISLGSSASGCTNWNILYNEFHMGWGPSHIQLDPTNKYIDCNSPANFGILTDGSIVSATLWSAGMTITNGMYVNNGPSCYQYSGSGTSGSTGPVGTTTGTDNGIPYTQISNAYVGWGDATWINTNRLYRGPTCVTCPTTRPDGGKFYGNYLHDITRGTKGLCGPGGLMQHNWYERCYHDFNDLGRGDTNPLAGGFGFEQNIIIDPIGHQNDNGNPHVDSDQLFWSYSPTSAVKVPGLRRSRNLVMGSNVLTRAMVQNGFWQMAADHYSAIEDVVSVAPKIRENIAIMLGTSHGLDLAVTEDAYVRGNEAFHPSTLANSYSPIAAFVSMDGARGISTARTDNNCLYADNVFEADVTPAATPGNLRKINNAILGVRGSRLISEATIFTGSLSGWPATPAAAFSYRMKQAAYNTLGNLQSTFVDFILAPMDWTGERPFAGFVDLVNQTAGATITSNPAWVHGGNPGQILAVNPVAGTQWRTLSAVDRSTVVQAYSSSPGTVTVDSEYLQVKCTAPTQGTTVDFGPTLGGVHQPWSVGSLSTAVFPTIQFNGGAMSFQKSGTGALSTDGQQVTMAVKVMLPVPGGPTYPAGNIRLLSDTSGNVLQCLVQTTGKILFSFKNSSGTTICSWTSPNDMRDGAWHTYIFSADMSQTTAAAGFHVTIDGSLSGTAPSTFDTSGAQNIFYSRATTTYYFGGSTTNQLPDGAQVAFCYLDITHAVDLTNSANIALFNADKINSDGSGPTGAQPIFFLVGNATQWSANAVHPTGSQWGSGALFTLIGTGSPTDVVVSQPAWS